jgi:hypothetical protein
MNPVTYGAPFRRASAIIPIAMSLAALSVVLVALVAGGPMRTPDEGTAAHLYQLLLAGQAPVIAFFAIKWLPRDPAQSLQVLGAQALAAALALVPVILLGL